MSKFTLQVQYLSPQWADVVIEAPTLAEACAKAVATDSIDGDGFNWQTDYDNPRPSYIVAALAGEHDNVVDSTDANALDIPEEFRADDARLSAILASALDYCESATLEGDRLPDFVEAGWHLLKDYGIQR